MDGQNFENENNVTVDTTATEVSSAAETVQETPVTEQPVNNYQDYTANVQPQAAATAPVQQPENKETNNLPIVAMTANAFSEDKQVALDAGMNDHIAKPINMSVLVPTLRKYL